MSRYLIEALMIPAVGDSWMEYAVCRIEKIPVSWFIREGTPDASAVAACDRCTVREQCREYAIATRSVGLWGGTSGRKRKYRSRVKTSEKRTGGRGLQPWTEAILHVCRDEWLSFSEITEKVAWSIPDDKAFMAARTAARNRGRGVPEDPSPRVLRAGRAAVVRTTCANLVRRGFLARENDLVRAANTGADSAQKTQEFHAATPVGSTAATNVGGNEMTPASTCDSGPGVVIESRVEAPDV